MARGINRLTVLEVTRAKPGMHSDGGGLWLRVHPGGRAWLFRYTSPKTGRERRMGLGPAQDVPLAEARDAAGDARKQLRAGLDPLDERDRTATDRKQALITFQKATEACIHAKAAGWRNPKHTEQWHATMKAHVYPKLGARPIASIGKADVLEVLTPLWERRPKTASKVRGRMEIVLDYSRQHDWRTGENPAAWKGNLEHVFASANKIAPVKHFAALPWQRIGEVMGKLAEADGICPLTVRFIALTAVRSMEARGAKWSEINLTDKVWIIPPERMKAGREHRVPLSAAALTVLEQAKPLAELEGNGAYVFPGGRRNMPLTDKGISKALHTAAGTTGVTVHGLRSTFRDWVAEATTHQPDVAEAALAHALGDAVRVSYQRGDLFEKRRGLMEEWEFLCTSLDRAGS